MNEKEISQLVARVLEQIGSAEVTNADSTVQEQNTSVEVSSANSITSSVHVRPTSTGNSQSFASNQDITEIDIRKQLEVKNPKNREVYLHMKSFTPARLGCGRAGNRYKTSSQLRFRADHGAAMDAVFSMVEPETIEEMGKFGLKLITSATICQTKDEYLTRPDYGKRFTDEEKNRIKSALKKRQNVQIVVGDGLSSAAIKANISDILPSLLQTFKNKNISVDELVFVEYCRVGAMDEISELSEAEVTLMLIGERPGLVTAKSMSAYICYKATVGMPEARRTVVSNIHEEGTNAIEAGAHIASIIERMMKEKKSGVDLKI